MAKGLSFESCLGVLLVAFLVNGLPVSVEKRDVTKDKAVREMYELLHARRQADSEVTNSETAPPPTARPSQAQVEEHTYLSTGGSSLTQLCTDAVTYLSNGESDLTKRNLVINHVYNLCIRPGSEYDVMKLTGILEGVARDGDWSVLGPPTTTPDLPTTVDPWEQLLAELFDLDIADEQDEDDVTTPTPGLLSTMENLDVLLDDFMDLLEEEYGELTTALTPSMDESELEASLEEFLHLLEEEEAQMTGGNDVTPTIPESTTGVASSTVVDLEVAFNDFWNLIEELEEEEDAIPIAPQTTTGAESTTTKPRSTTGPTAGTTIDLEQAFNDFWNMVDEDGEEDTPGDDDATTSPPPADDNDLPPVDVNKRNEMKKRLLNLLAKTLVEREAMRK